MKLRWTVTMWIHDGMPLVDWEWQGLAANRADALAKARAAYPDATCRHEVRTVTCREVQKPEFVTQ